MFVFYYFTFLSLYLISESERTCICYFVHCFCFFSTNNKIQSVNSIHLDIDDTVMFLFLHLQQEKT